MNIPNSFTTMKEFRNASAKIAIASRSLDQVLKIYLPETVKFFYGNGNKQVEIINTALNTLSQLSGMRLSAVIDWFAEVIPHELKKNKDGKFFFSSKQGDYNEFKVITFLKDNPCPFKWKKDTTPTAFNVQKYGLTVVQKLAQAGVSIQEFTELLYKEKAEIERKAAEKAVKQKVA